MSKLHLAKFVLQQVGARALQDPQRAALKTGGVFAGFDAFSACFHPDHPDRFILEKGIKQSHRIRTAADAGNEQVRQSLFLLLDLPACFIADPPLKIAHH